MRRQRNDPLLDSKLAVEAFANQLDRLAGASPEPLTAWHWLTAGGKGDGFDLVLSTLREKTRSTLEECHASIIPAGLAPIGLAVPLSAPEGYGQNGRPTDHCGLPRLQFRAAPALWPSLPERDECEHGQNFAHRSIMQLGHNRGPATPTHIPWRPGVGAGRRAEGLRGRGEQGPAEPFSRERRSDWLDC